MFAEAIKKLPLKVLPPLTANQAKCLVYVTNFFLQHRYYPTHREIAEAMELRTNTAEMFIGPLVQKGYLIRQRGRHRNIRLTKSAISRLELMGEEVLEQLSAA
jgi:DNA-binding MarR family transcriptional regulator